MRQIILTVWLLQVVANPQETPELYEIKDGKPNVVQFEFKNDLYVVGKLLDDGAKCGRGNGQVKGRPRRGRELLAKGLKGGGIVVVTVHITQALAQGLERGLVHATTELFDALAHAPATGSVPMRARDAHRAATSRPVAGSR